MFQPRGEEGEEKEVTEYRIKKYLRMQENSQRPQFRKPADMREFNSLVISICSPKYVFSAMSGGSAGGRIAKSGGTLHSYIAQQLGTARNADFLTDKDVRGSILRHAEEVRTLYIIFKIILCCLGRKESYLHFESLREDST
jgi:hypothetical protein